MPSELKNILEFLPQWVLVLLSAIGIWSIRSFLRQIKQALETQQQHAVKLNEHSADINELKKISAKLQVIVESLSPKPPIEFPHRPAGQHRHKPHHD